MSGIKKLLTYRTCEQTDLIDPISFQNGSNKASVQLYVYFVCQYKKKHLKSKPNKPKIKKKQS